MSWLRGYQRVPTRKPDLGNASGGRVREMAVDHTKATRQGSFFYF